MKTRLFSVSHSGDRELRRQVLERLEAMNRASLFHTTCFLMKGMGYRDIRIVGNVNKHGRSFAGGVDIVATISQGGVRAQTVVQVKALRDGRTVQRRFVDELRSAMPRFTASQAIIFANRSFSPIAEEVAEFMYGPPVRLINGNWMARLMIKNGVGVRLKPLSANSLPDWMLDEVFFEHVKGMAK
jgi:restriction endonuclease Mrr